MATKAKLPSRLHHTAYVSKDLEATRKFYEEVIGLPLLATLCEKDMLFGAERAPATKLAPTRYDRVVEAFGGRGEHVEDPQAIAPALHRAFELEKAEPGVPALEP